MPPTSAAWARGRRIARLPVPREHRGIIGAIDGIQWQSFKLRDLRENMRKHFKINKQVKNIKQIDKLLADQNLCFPVFLSYFSRKRCKSEVNMFLPNQRDLKLKTPFSGNGVHMKHSAQSPSPQDGPNMPNMVRVQGPRASRTHFFKISIHQMDHQTDLPSCFFCHTLEVRPMT